MKKRKVYSLLLIIFLFLAGCKDEYSICNESRNVLLQANLFTVNSGVEQSFAASSFSLSVINNPQPIYKNITGLTSFLLPLTPGLDSTVYQIITSSTATPDTLSIFYSTNNVQLSAPCGTINMFRILRVSSTHNSIDSIRVKNAEVSNLQKENIKIYY
jgi:hypothetical protein